jgi:hypothetical protein
MTQAEGVIGREPARDETPAERSDRNWAELLQELRVAQTGIQILSGFLLTHCRPGPLRQRRDREAA